MRELREISTAAVHDGDETWATAGLFHAAQGLCYLGDLETARVCCDAFGEAAEDLGNVYHRYSFLLLGFIAVAAGELEAAERADDEAWQDIDTDLSMVKINIWRRAAVALARGDLVTARRWADEAVAATTGWHRAVALTTRARVAIAQGDVAQAESDAHSALALAVEVNALLGVPDTLDNLATLACDANSHAEAARLFGAADGMRRRTGEVRFRIYQDAHEDVLDRLRKAVDPNDFEAAWTEGTQLSTDEAVAYAQRGRGERKRPSSGWASLTPAELDVVRLVCEGLGNKEVAARLFVSPRTVQAHLSHVYTKLGISTRVQLVQEAARNATSQTQTSVE